MLVNKNLTRKLWFVVVFFCYPLCTGSFSILEDSEEQRYFKERSRLIASSEDHTVGSNIVLSNMENKANDILMHFKISDLKKGVRIPKSFLAAKHFFISQPLIEKSCIYKLIQKLPKGASLHTHSTSLVSYEYLFNNLTYREDLYALENEGGKIQLHFFKSAPNKTWKSVRYLRSIDPTFTNRLSKQISLVRENPYELNINGDDVWIDFENYFKIVKPLLKYKPVFQDYLYQALKEHYEDNVKYLEVRGHISGLYDLDGNKSDPEAMLQTFLEITEKFKKDYPDFIGVKVIYAPNRRTNLSKLERNINIFRSLKRKYPHFIAGFDLVGQEDLGSPLKDFIPQFLDLKKDSNLFFHAGETLWNGDTVDQNLFDAVMLNTSRIGHGYAILKHPEIYKLVKERKIPLEISPISNQVLGLVHDLRNHPATHLIANNFPVVITSDDSTCWGAKALSYDWYMAFMALSGKNADLRFLKQLAINSIIFSSMNVTEKSIALAQWQSDWDIFINKVVTFRNCE